VNKFEKMYDVSINNDDEYVKITFGNWFRLQDNIRKLIRGLEYYAHLNHAIDNYNDGGAYARQKLEEFKVISGLKQNRCTDPPAPDYSKVCVRYEDCDECPYG